MQHYPNYHNTGDVTDNSLPLKDAGIRYHAWNNENDFKDGDLKKLEDFSDGTHTWSDIYQAQLDKSIAIFCFIVVQMVRYRLRLLLTKHMT